MKNNVNKKKTVKVGTLGERRKSGWLYYVKGQNIYRMKGGKK
jgi:hypothetical protein